MATFSTISNEQEQHCGWLIMDELLKESSEEGTRIRRGTPCKCNWAWVHGEMWWESSSIANCVTTIAGDCYRKKSGSKEGYKILIHTHFKKGTGSVLKFWVIQQHLPCLSGWQPFQLGLGQGFIFISSPKCLDDTKEDDNALQEVCSECCIVPTHVYYEGKYLSDV